MKARQLEASLSREPLRYRVTRRTGSHRRLESEARFPPLTWAFHDSVTLPPRLVRKILTKDIGLTEDEAQALL